MPVQLNLPEIRAEAKNLLKTARVSPVRMAALFFGVTLVLNLISTAVSFLSGSTFDLLSLSFSFVDTLIMLLGLVLSAGFSGYCLSVQRGETAPYESLFDAFPFAGKVILLNLLMLLAIGTGLTLFFVPGIVLAFSYSNAVFHLCETPDIGVIEALRRSRQEMRGYKWQLLQLLLSFWPLLLLLTLVEIGEYYLNGLLPATLSGNLFFTLSGGLMTILAEVYWMPYAKLAHTVFYRRVTGQTGLNVTEDIWNA